MNRSFPSRSRKSFVLYSQTSKGFFPRLVSGILLPVFLFTSVLPLSLLAQSVPQLNKDKQFRSQDLQPYVNAGANQTTESGFTSILQGGKEALEAAWEAEVGAEINTIVSGVGNNGDPVNSVEVYRQAVRSQLELEKQQSKSVWLADITSYIQSEVNLFLKGLTAKKDQDIQSSKNSLLSSIDPTVEEAKVSQANLDVRPADASRAYRDGVALWDSKWSDLQSKRASWESDSLASIQNGILQWNASISGMQEEKESYLGNIENTKRQWLENKSKIEQAESAVRASLQGTITHIRNQQSQLNSVIHTDSILNSSFGSLNELLNTIQSQLDSKASLHVMTKTLGDYFQRQANYADSKAGEWNTRKWETTQVGETITFNLNVGTANFSCSSPQGGNCSGLSGNGPPLRYYNDGSVEFIDPEVTFSYDEKTGRRQSIYYRQLNSLQNNIEFKESQIQPLTAGIMTYDYNYYCPAGAIEIGGSCSGGGGYDMAGNACSSPFFCGYHRRKVNEFSETLTIFNTYEQDKIANNDKIRNTFSGAYNVAFNASGAEGYQVGSHSLVSTGVRFGGSNGDFLNSSDWYGRLDYSNSVYIQSTYRYIDRNSESNQNTWLSYKSQFNNLANTFLGLVNPLKSWEERSKTYSAEYQTSLDNLDKAKLGAVTRFDEQISSLVRQRDQWITDTYGLAVAGTGAVANPNSKFLQGKKDWEETITTFKSVELNWLLTAKETLRNAVEDPEKGEKRFQGDTISAVEGIKTQIVDSYGTTTQLYDTARRLWSNQQYSYSTQLLDQAVSGKSTEVALGQSGASLSQKLIDSYSRAESYTLSEIDATDRINSILGMYSQSGYDSSEYGYLTGNLSFSREGQREYSDELTGSNGRFGFTPRIARDRDTLATYQDVALDAKRASALQREVVTQENELLTRANQFFTKASEFLALAREHEGKGQFEEATYYTNQAIQKKAEASSILSKGYAELGEFMLSGVSSRGLSHTRVSFLAYRDTLLAQSFQNENEIARQIKAGKDQIAGIVTSSEAYDKIQNLLTTSQNLIRKGGESIQLADKLLEQSKELASKNLKGDLLEGLNELIASLDTGSPEIVSDGSEVGDAITASNEALKETKGKVDALLSRMNSLVTNESDIAALSALLNGSGEALNFAANSAIASYLDSYSQQFIEDNIRRSAELRKQLLEQFATGSEYAYLREAGYTFIPNGDTILGYRKIESGDVGVSGFALLESSYTALLTSQYLTIQTKFDPGTLRIDTIGIDELRQTSFDASRVLNVVSYVQNMKENMGVMFAKFSDKGEEARQLHAQNQIEKQENLRTYNQLKAGFLQGFQGLEGGFASSYNPTMDGLQKNYGYSDYKFSPGTGAGGTNAEAWRSIQAVPVTQERFLGSRELKGTVNIKGIPIEVTYGAQYLNVPSKFSLASMGYNLDIRGEGATFLANHLAMVNNAFTQYVDGTTKDIEAIAKANEAEKESKGFIFDVLSGTSSGQSVAQSFKSVVTERVNGAVTGAIATATGLPAGLISGLVGGKSMKDAMKDYAKQEATNAISQATGIPAWALSQQLDKMSKPKEKFYETKEFQVVTAVAAVALAPFTGGASLAVAMSASAAIGAAQGAASGGLKGALVGAAGGALGAVTRSFTGGALSVGLSYDSANGFGASIGVGAPGLASANIGVTQKGGVTAGLGIPIGDPNSKDKIGLSYSQKEGFSASLAMGSMTMGVNLGGPNGPSVYAGVVTDETGSKSVGMGYNAKTGVEAYAKVSSSSGSGKLTYNKEDGFGAQITVNTKSGASGTLGISERGGVTASLDTERKIGDVNVSGGISYNSKEGFSANLNYTSGSQAANGLSKVSGGLSLNRDGLTVDPLTATTNASASILGPIRSLNDLERETEKVAEAKSEEYMVKKEKAMYDDFRKQHEKNPELANLSDEQIKVLKKTLAKDHGISTDPLADGTSRESVFSEITGGVTDVLNMAAGNYRGATQDGFVDADGKFHQRTCFVAGTKVHTLNGLKNIEDIHVGDVVLSWNEETGKKEYKTVTELFLHEVTLLYEIQVEATLLETTWNHPFWVVNENAWVEAKDLKVGDFVLLENGQTSFLHGIKKKPVTHTKVYNFEVEGNHTYFVGDDGVLVHNYVLTALNVASLGMGVVDFKEAYDKGDKVGMAISGVGIVVDGATLAVGIPGAAGAVIRQVGKKAAIESAEQIAKIGAKEIAERGSKEYGEQLLKKQATGAILSKAEKGDLAEHVGKKLLDGVDGFKAIDAKNLKLPKNNGIDNLFIKYGKDGKTIEKVIVQEDKYTATGKYTLGKGYDSKQLKDKWLKGVMTEMENKPNLEEARKALEYSMDKGKLEKRIHLYNEKGSRIINVP